MLLTTKERHKFIKYCKQHINSCKALKEQIQKLSMGDLSELVDKQHTIASAYEVVLKDLESVEDYSVLDQTHSE